MKKEILKKYDELLEDILKSGDLAKYSDFVCTCYTPKACRFYSTEKCKTCSENVQNMRQEDFK